MTAGKEGKRMEAKDPWKLIADAGYESVVVFSSPSYAGAFLGVTHDGRSAYDLSLMAEWLVEEEGFGSYDEAYDFISYNSSFGGYGDYPVIIDASLGREDMPDPEDGVPGCLGPEADAALVGIAWHGPACYRADALSRVPGGREAAIAAGAIAVDMLGGGE